MSALGLIKRTSRLQILMSAFIEHLRLNRQQLAARAQLAELAVEHEILNRKQPLWRPLISMLPRAPSS